MKNNMKLSKENMEYILDIYPKLLWIKDLEGKLIYINRTYEQYVEKGKKELIGTKGIAINANEIKVERMKTSYGERIIECYQNTLYDNGEKVGVKGVGYDITPHIKIVNEFESVVYLYTKFMKEIKVTKYKEELTRCYLKLVARKCMNQHDVAYCFFEELEDEVYATKPIYKQISLKLINHLRNREDRVITRLPIEILKKYINTDCLEQLQITHIVYYPICFRGELIGGALRYITTSQIEVDYIDYHIKASTNYIGAIRMSSYLNREVLEDLEQRLKKYLDVVTYTEKNSKMILLVDKDKKMVRLGNGWNEILGWRAEEVGQIERHEMISTNEFIKIQNLSRATKKDYQSRSTKVIMKSKSKEEKNILINISYSQEYKVLLLTGEEYKSEKQLEENKKILQQEVEMEIIKGNLFFHLSEEFKEPVNVVLYGIEMLENYFEKIQEEHGYDMDLKKYIKIIKHNAYRLIRLINNLVDINSIEDGSYKLNTTKCNIVEVIEEIVQSIRVYVCQKDIECIFNKQIQYLEMVCDPEKIERILLNILSNSIKYTEKGGQISLTINVEKGSLCIRVADTGEGIKKENLERIFDKFVRVETSMTRKREGSGIGLAIVKSLVEMHEGTIEVESEVGKGSVFTIKLPIENELKAENDERVQQRRSDNWNIEFADIYDE